MRRVVITGGPGAGKTASLEVARRTLCEHVGFARESASIVFGGGFPREHREAAACAAQRAIFHVQRELETPLGRRILGGEVRDGQNVYVDFDESKGELTFTAGLPQLPELEPLR